MATASQIPLVIGVSLTLAISCLLAEFFGYWLHRLLHSDKVPFLSRGHLIHHLLIYGPGQPMRHDHYHHATDNRFSVGNVGLEWLAPSAIILAMIWALMAVLHVPALYQALALVTLIAWPAFMFSYLHDRMHLKEFWMAQNPALHSWFRAARRLHDIHHHAVDNSGHMDANFGIGFFLFDRAFRTIATHHRPFNRAGFEAARRRYGLIEQNGKLVTNGEFSVGFCSKFTMICGRSRKDVVGRDDSLLAGCLRRDRSFWYGGRQPVRQLVIDPPCHAIERQNLPTQRDAVTIEPAAAPSDTTPPTVPHRTL